jgi:uncharacterized protein YbaR (Trm112 family)
MNDTNGELPISRDLLEILRDPLAVQEPEKYGDDPGRLELVRGYWLVSKDSGLKYPIRDGIPVMLIEEGMKWKDTAVEDLPVPPPADKPAPVSPIAAPTATTSGEQSANLPVIGAVVAGGLGVVLLLRRLLGNKNQE